MSPPSVLWKIPCPLSIFDQWSQRQKHLFLRLRALSYFHFQAEVSLLEVEPRVLCMLGKYSATEPHLWIFKQISKARLHIPCDSQSDVHCPGCHPVVRSSQPWVLRISCENNTVGLCDVLGARVLPLSTVGQAETWRGINLPSRLSTPIVKICVSARVAFGKEAMCLPLKMPFCCRCGCWFGNLPRCCYKTPSKGCWRLYFCSSLWVQ